MTRLQTHPSTMHPSITGPNQCHSFFPRNAYPYDFTPRCKGVVRTKNPMPPQVRNLSDTYCVDCHRERRKGGGTLQRIGPRRWQAFKKLELRHKSAYSPGSREESNAVSNLSFDCDSVSNDNPDPHDQAEARCVAVRRAWFSFCVLISQAGLVRNARSGNHESISP